MAFSRTFHNRTYTHTIRYLNKKLQYSYKSSNAIGQF